MHPSDYRNITVSIALSNKILTIQKNVLFSVDINVSSKVHFASHNQYCHRISGEIRDRKPVLKELVLEIQDRIAVIALNHDDVRSALTGTALVEGLLQTLVWVNRAEGVS